MSDKRQVTVELPSHMVEFIDQLVRSGQFASADDYLEHVIRVAEVDPAVVADITRASAEFESGQHADAAGLFDRLTAKYASHGRGQG